MMIELALVCEVGLANLARPCGKEPPDLQLAVVHGPQKAHENDDFVIAGALCYLIQLALLAEPTQPLGMLGMTAAIATMPAHSPVCHEVCCGRLGTPMKPVSPKHPLGTRRISQFPLIPTRGSDSPDA
mmetsp:Transcript_57416/g.114053  ORF Transcript_57416/g.114053 Transcript_57416/m.114053 type:complete len:128 (-) Transcript_57416:163-546(-)